MNQIKQKMMKPKIIFKDFNEYNEMIEYFVNKSEIQFYEMRTTLEILEEIFNNQETIDGDKLTVSLNVDFGKYGDKCEYAIETNCIKKAI